MKWAFWSEWEKVTTDRRMDCQNLSYLQVPILPAPSALFFYHKLLSALPRKCFPVKFQKRQKCPKCPESPEMRSFVLGK